MAGDNERIGDDGQEQDWDSGEDQPLETDQLELAEEEGRLPWLESADDGYEEEEDTGTGRLIGLLAIGLIVLAAIVGAIWWATHRSPDPALVADGSTIAAPADPYKEAPKDPGGKTFDGTGDSSFAVSEGQTRPAQLGGETAAPAPVASASVAAAAAPAPKPAASASPAAPAPVSGGVGVQVGAFSSKAAAEAGWSKLVGQSNGALSGVSHRVIEGSADIGKVYRLQAVAGDAAGAQALCGKLKAAGISCQVK
ncbi:MAG: SPOR domain-containing protein [Novosphingobium sp.]|nr:SPOR domain-containing protein [Novosphingobium sp.]